jgi:hypothetical protein
MITSPKLIAMPTRPSAPVFASTMIAPAPAKDEREGADQLGHERAQDRPAHGITAAIFRSVRRNESQVHRLETSLKHALEDSECGM